MLLYFFYTIFTLFQICEVAQNLALSRMKRDCDFSKGCSEVDIDSQPTDHHRELARLLFQRCGFFGNEKKSLSICKGHFKEFTDNFTKRYTQKTTCMNIYHHQASKIAVTKKKTGWPCSLHTMFVFSRGPPEGFRIPHYCTSKVAAGLRLELAHER